MFQLKRWLECRGLKPVRIVYIVRDISFGIKAIIMCFYSLFFRKTFITITQLPAHNLPKTFSKSSLLFLLWIIIICILPNVIHKITYHFIPTPFR